MKSPPRMCAASRLNQRGRTRSVPGSKQEARDQTASAAPGKRLHPTRIAHECNHDGKAAEEEKPLHDVHTVFTKVEQVGDGPSACESGSKNLGADQDRRADDSQHTRPCNAPVPGQGGSIIHGLVRHAAWRLAGDATSPASTNAWRICSISSRASLTKGGRTTARGRRASSTSASFMR